MASVVTPQWVVNEIAYQFLNRCVLAKNANRSYDSQFRVKGAKVGATINARLPQRPRAASGAQLNKQPVIDQVTPISITDQTNIGLELSSYTLTLEKSEIMRTCIIPAANALVQDMENKGFSRLYKKIPNSIGSVGVSPTAGLTYSQGNAKLVDMNGNNRDLVAILSSDQSAVIADAQKAYFAPTGAISSAFTKGQFGGPAYGIEKWFSSPNVAVHTTGATTTATPIVSASANVVEGATSLSSTGWGSGNTTIQEGDWFTMAGVYEINSATFTSTNRLRQFTVTQTTTDSSGTVTLNFYPPLYAAATPLQNVTALPANSAVITYLGMSAGGSQTATTSRQGLIFAEDSLVLAMADAEDVDAPVCVFARDEELGISMRLTKSFDISNDNNLARLDMFWGWNAIRPEWTCLRVQGA
jgi:hypothetical protein